MAKEEKKEEEKKGFVSRFGKAAREMIYGMAAHDTARFALKTRGSMEHLFILITMGDLLGVPILPPYYSLRILALRGSADCHLEAKDASRARPDGRFGLKGRRGSIPVSRRCIQDGFLKNAMRSALCTLPNKEVCHSTRGHFHKVS